MLAKSIKINPGIARHRDQLKRGSISRSPAIETRSLVFENASTGRLEARCTLNQPEKFKVGTQVHEMSVRGSGTPEVTVIQGAKHPARRHRVHPRQHQVP